MFDRRGVVLSRDTFRRHGFPSINVPMNPGATRWRGQTLISARVEDRVGGSAQWAARSEDGVKDWELAAEPYMEPSDEALIRPDGSIEGRPWEFGIEDTRLTVVSAEAAASDPRLQVDDIVSAYTAHGYDWTFGPVPRPGLAISRDGLGTVHEDLGFTRPYGTHGEDKNVTVFFLNGRWYRYHRPVAGIPGSDVTVNGIWMCTAPTLWGPWSESVPVMMPGIRAVWDGSRIGMGPQVVVTPKGILVVYHGVQPKSSGRIYRWGLALFDLNNPAKVLARVPHWVFGPEADYEMAGDVPAVAFPNGLTHDPDTGILRVYYGGADSCIAMAETSSDILLDHIERHGVADAANLVDGLAILPPATVKYVRRIW